MDSLECTNSLQPWACSSLSSSEKFLSLYEKMQEDREKKNMESLFFSPFTEQDGPLQDGQQQQFPPLLPPALMMVDKPSSQIVFPHITSRGSLVGKKVYCRTSIRTNITWRQKSSSQRMRTSSMILNFYQDRSSSSNRLLLGGKQQQTQSSPAAGPADSVTLQKRPDQAIDNGQCRELFLRLAGAAGMRLICPPLQLPLLEILLFFREQLSKNRAAPHSARGAGLWRLPVNLALATLRPFSGSLAGRCLTTLLCLPQMRFKESNNYIITEQHNVMRHMPVPADLYSVVTKKECNDLDRKELTKICSTDQFQIDDLVVTMTEADDDDEAGDRAGQNNNDNNIPCTMLLSNVVLGPKFEEECWSNNGVQVVELFSESEGSDSDHTAPKSLAQDKENIGSDSGCGVDFESSLVDLEEDLSPEPRIKRRESEKSSSEDVGAEDARKESFAHSTFAVSPPAFQSLLEAPSSITVVMATAERPGTVSIPEEDAMPLTGRMCLAEEEHLDATSISLTTRNLKTSTEELKDDDEPCSAPSDCDAASVLVESCVSAPQALAEEKVEDHNHLGNELHDGKFAHFVKGESADRLVEQEVEVCCIEEHRIDDSNWESLEGLQVQVEVSVLEITSAESESEKESSDKLRGGQFKVEFDGDAIDCVSSEKLPEQTDVFLPQGTSDGHEFENLSADVTLPVESLSLVLCGTAENQAVMKPLEVKSEHCVAEEESVGRALNGPIEEHIMDGSVWVSPERLPDLIELLMEANWIGARKEFAKAVLTVEKQLPALTGVAENQAVKDRQEGKSTHSLGGESTAMTLDHELEVCPIEDQKVGEIQEVKSEYYIEDKLEEEHRIDANDCDDWLESLLEQVETFISERADVLSEYEKAAVTDIVENQAVKDIQEVNFTSPVNENSPKIVLNQECEVCPIEEYRIDDWRCAPSDRLQRHTEVFLSFRASSENELDEKESPTASPVSVSVENPSLSLTESLEKEVVKDIHEVNTAHLTEEKPADGLFNQGLEVGSVEERRIGDRDCELLEILQGECDSLISDGTSPEIESVKGVSAAAAVALSMEVQLCPSTELFEDQPIKEIQEVKASDLIRVERYEERVVNQELEVCSIECHGIDDRNCKLLKRLHVKVEGSLPESNSAETLEKELSADLRGINLEVDFEEDAGASQQEESNCASSTSSQGKCTGQEHDLRPSTAMTGNDSQSEDTFSSDHFGASSRESCLEHPESKLIYGTDECSSEPSTEISVSCGAWRKSSYARCFDSYERILLLCILLVPFLCSLTSRLNAANKAEDKALNPDTGAIAVVLDGDLNRDEKDGHEATEAKVRDTTKSGSIVADGDRQESTVPTETPIVAARVTSVVSASDENGSLDQSSGAAEEIGGSRENNCFPEKFSKISQLLDALGTESCPEHPFADHPTCIELRQSRHSHGDQTYIDMQDLLPAPWGQLIFWHGRCKEGRPTLCVLLGKAVRQLPGHELKNFIEVTVSHLEYAELNFFKGNVKQMNILMDLEGLGFMRLPPMHILSAIGAVLNRDYAGRGGWIILVNAPLMLGFLINAIQGVILRPSNNKGAVIDSSFKGFLEGKERIMMMGGNYRRALEVKSSPQLTIKTFQKNIDDSMSDEF